MTVPFAMIPAGLVNDGRVAALPPGAELLLYRLYLRAVTCTEYRDRIPLQRGVAYATAARFIVGEDTARLDAIIQQGLAVIEGDHLRLTVTVASLAADSAKEPRAGTERAQETARLSDVVPGKPSASKAAQRARNDRAKFNSHLAPFKDVETGLTWEQWVETTEGAAFCREREVSFPGYRAWVTPQGNAVRNTQGNAKVTPQGNTPSETSFSSVNSEEEKREEREVGEGNAKVTPQGNTPKVTPLDVLREAAGSTASLVGNPDLERGLLDQLTRRKLSVGVLRAMAVALATPGAWWRGKGGTEYITLTDLAGYCDHGVYAWKALDWLVAHAVKQGRDVKPTTTPSPLLDRPLTAAERAANGARLRDALAASRAATPPTPGDTAP